MLSWPLHRRPVRCKQNIGRVDIAFVCVHRAVQWVKVRANRFLDLFAAPVQAGEVQLQFVPELLEVIGGS